MTGISETAKYDASKIKEIRGVSTDSETTESRLIALAAWMKETYGSTMIQALKTVLPVKDKVRAKEKRLIFLQEKRKRVRHFLTSWKAAVLKHVNGFFGQSWSREPGLYLCLQRTWSRHFRS